MPDIAPTARIGPNVQLAADVVVEDHVVLGSPERAHAPVAIGPGSVIRAGTVIYPDVRAGAGLQTGHHAVIRAHTVLGESVVVGSNVVIDGDCQIGDRVKLQSNAYVPTHTVIEDDVFLGPAATLTNDKPMGAYVRGIYPRSRPLRGPTLRRGARIGANATVLPELEIGEEAVVGAGAVVTRDVAPGVIVAGVPATERGPAPIAQRLPRRERGSWRT